jgi:integrase/recombinase XerD
LGAVHEQYEDTLRHTTAVHLLEAGVEVNVIRAWLGHASLETTNRYAEITLRTKHAALEKCTVPRAADERIPRKPRWQTDATLLTWLQSL